MNSNMALQTGYETEEWEDYFIKAGISADSAKSYATNFVREKLRKENLQSPGNHTNGKSSLYPETNQGALYPDHLH